MTAAWAYYRHILEERGERGKEDGKEEKRKGRKEV